MTMYEKYCQLKIDGRWIGLEKSDLCVDYFCTPINATVIGWENSIHYCFIKGYRDMDIYSNVPISFAVAALGGTIQVDTVDGKVEYDVKPGTQTGTRVRLRGKGVPSLRNKSVRGDHYITLNVQVPTSLSHEAKEALREFDAVSGNSLKSESVKPKKKGFMDKIKETFED